MDVEFLKIIKVAKSRKVFSIWSSFQNKSSKSLSLKSRLKCWGAVILQTFFWQLDQIRTIGIYSKIEQPLIIYVTNNEIDDGFHQWIQRRENLFTNYKLSFLARRDGCVGCWYCITYLAVIEWGAIYDLRLKLEMSSSWNFPAWASPSYEGSEQSRAGALKFSSWNRADIF